MKKITVRKLLNICHSGEKLILFKKLNLQNINFEKIKEFKIYTMNNYNFLNWLCKKFNLSLTIIYDGYKSIYESGKLIHQDINGYKENWIYKNKILTHYEDSTGVKKDYNEFGKITHYEDSTGYTEDYKYNELGLIIHYKNSNGFIEDYKYNKLGLKTHYEDSTGHKEDYNDFGKLIYRKDSTEYEEEWIYKDIILICYKNSKGYKDIYNDFGKLIYRKDYDSLIRNWLYDDSGKIIHYECSNGYKEDYIYNKIGKLIDIVYNYEFIEDELKYEIK